MGEHRKIEGTPLPSTLEVGRNIVPMGRVLNASDLAIEIQKPTPRGYRPLIDGVIVNTDERNGHLYKVGGGKFGLSGAFWDLVAGAAGIALETVWVREVKLTDSSGELNPGVEVKVRGYRQQPGELPLMSEAIVSMSYWDYAKAKGLVDRNHVQGCPQKRCKCPIIGMKENAVTFAVRGIETSAKNRVVRKLTGLAAGYPMSQLQRDGKPAVFAFRRCIQDLDDPEIRRAHMQQMNSAQARLYGGHIEEKPEDLPESEAPTGETLDATDPEIAGGIREDEDAEWEDLEDQPQQSEPASQERFLPAWPEKFDAAIRDELEAAIQAEDKRLVYAALKKLDGHALAPWFSYLMASWGYDSNTDRKGIMSIWNDGKEWAIQRALTKLVIYRKGGQL